MTALREELSMLDNNFSLLKAKEKHQDEYDKEIERRLLDMKNERDSLRIKTIENGDDVDKLIEEIKTEVNTLISLSQSLLKFTGA